jgi:hypothetical protein
MYNMIVWQSYLRHINARRREPDIPRHQRAPLARQAGEAADSGAVILDCRRLPRRGAIGIPYVKHSGTRRDGRLTAPPSPDLSWALLGSQVGRA